MINFSHDFPTFSCSAEISPLPCRAPVLSSVFRRQQKKNYATERESSCIELTSAHLDDGMECFAKSNTWVIHCQSFKKCKMLYFCSNYFNWFLSHETLHVLKVTLVTKRKSTLLSTGLRLFAPPGFIAARPDYLMAALLDNHDDMTAAWQPRTSQPVTDWQPIPAVILSSMTPLHSSICHFFSSALGPLPPTPPFNYSCISLCP